MSVDFLHDLDVSDEHWLLIPLMRVGWINGIVVEGEKGQITMGDTLPIPGDGIFFFDFGPGCKVKDKGKITVDVVFDDIGIPLLKGMPVMSDLDAF